MIVDFLTADEGKDHFINASNFETYVFELAKRMSARCIVAKQKPGSVRNHSLEAKSTVLQERLRPHVAPIRKQECGYSWNVNPIQQRIRK